MRNSIPILLGGMLLVATVSIAGAGQAQNFSVVYTFTGGADGGTAFANLLLSGTTLYGTTSAGGTHNAGTVFQIDTTTNTETVLQFPLSQPLADLYRRIGSISRVGPKLGRQLVWHDIWWWNAQFWNCIQDTSGRRKFNATPQLQGSAHGRPGALRHLGDGSCRRILWHHFRGRSDHRLWNCV